MDNYKCNHTIAILLAAYNGAKYLRNQFDSILWQTNSDWEIFVHDDCSNDGTIDIIKEYCLKDPRIHLTVDNISKSRGVKLSFIWLLENVDANYYMFSDQDDIWLPGKIDYVYKRMMIEERKTPHTPLFIYTDKSVGDENCFVTAKSNWNLRNMSAHFLDSYDAYLVMCKAAGCTSLLNAEARNASFPFPPKAFMHDWWIALATYKNGGRCIGLPACTMIYRQHLNNVCGAKKTYSRSILIRKIATIKTTIVGNVDLYTFMHSITGCSSFKYIYAKLRVVFYRIFTIKYVDER